MYGDEDERLDAIEARMHREDPRFAGALAVGQACAPREYRYTSAWVLLAVAVLIFVGGMLLGHGLLLATGLVLAGISGHLFDPQRKRPRTAGPPPRFR